MITRRSFLVLALGLVFQPGRALSQKAPQTDVEFLKRLTLEILEQSRVKPGTNGPPNWPIKNSVGFALVTPGRQGYPAFWIRDFSMACDSGLVPTQEIRNHLFLVARCQNGESERKLQSGAFLPPYAIPDHINFDGTAVFFPGTYSSGEDQGGGPWGKLPPIDDHFEFVHLAHMLWKQGRSRAFLQEQVIGIPLNERLKKAFESPESDRELGLATTSVGRRAVGFGFCDSIVHTGHLLYASLLRFRAANELDELTGDREYRRIADRIKQAIPETFQDPASGWLLASTGISRQPDVWGTLLALHLGVLDAKAANRALTTVLDAFKAGQITLEGAVRHVPTNRDFSEKTAWEGTYTGKGSYQNGAYWHTSTGWLIEALAKVDRAAAKQVMSEFVAHLRANPASPWECFGPGLNYTQNPGYLASVAWPYASLKNLKL